ncbi:gamma-glutamylcyclotransferase [Alteromonas facilis]|uniref:gamma-glutamylcyclotransferase n=1 Tax=Alteromonas facilis TaxID=2048004 RepID=UPI000C294128|nr:gamma-glutamylcyclotransferase [Alteromonas facilis]
MLGYGSLLSADSRERHSDHAHAAFAVSVKGFSRGWVTRAYHENQTYVGAEPASDSYLNALCTPIALNPKFQQRERDYQFKAVGLEQISFLEDIPSEYLQRIKRPGVTLWICESLDIAPASVEYPVYLSYVDTCLAGCLSHFANLDEGLDAARTFLQTTHGWQHVIDDRANPQYPRRANVSREHQHMISSLLNQHNISVRDFLHANT